MYSIEQRENVYANYYRFDNEVDIRRLKTLDSYAANDIKRCLEIIENCNQYRKDLAEYTQRLLQEQPTRELRLKREAHWQGKKFYYIGIYEIYTNGETKILSETYSGTERHAALRRYEELKKQHPGIKAIKDIEKGRWEK